MSDVAPSAPLVMPNSNGPVADQSPAMTMEIETTQEDISNSFQEQQQDVSIKQIKEEVITNDNANQFVATTNSEANDESEEQKAVDSTKLKKEPQRTEKEPGQSKRFVNGSGICIISICVLR